MAPGSDGEEEGIHLKLEISAQNSFNLTNLAERLAAVSTLTVQHDPFRDTDWQRLDIHGEVSAEEIARIRAKHAFLKALTVPAGSYPGQDRAIESVGSWSFVMTRPTLPDDVAYRLARALHRGEAEIARRLPAARETTAANTVTAAPRPGLIHPGVARYLGEIGLLR